MTQLPQREVDLVTFSDLLGHESVTTLPRYTTSAQADSQAAVEGLVNESEKGRLPEASDDELAGGCNRMSGGTTEGLWLTTG